jgi:hypothetical protein
VCIPSTGWVREKNDQEKTQKPNKFDNKSSQFLSKFECSYLGIAPCSMHTIKHKWIT